MSTSLHDLQSQLWLAQAQQPQTLEETLSRLGSILSASQEAFSQGHWVIGQQKLEDTLAEVLLAMRQLDMNPEQALGRVLARLQHANSTQTFKIKGHRVEIWVGSECRGGWDCLSPEEFETLRQLAQSLGCVIEQEDSTQLQLL